MRRREGWQSAQRQAVLRRYCVFVIVIVVVIIVIVATAVGASRAQAIGIVPNNTFKVIH